MQRKQFESEDFWYLQLNHAGVVDSNNLNVLFDWKRNRLFDQNAVTIIFDLITNHNPIVYDVQK